MVSRLKQQIFRLSRWSERYTKTNTLYVVASSLWLNIGRIIGIGSGLLLTTAFANLLTPETFGAYKYILAVAGLVAAFGLNGMGSALSRAIAQKKYHVIPSVVRTTMLWALPASIVSASIAAYYFTQGNTLLGWGFLGIAIFNVFSSGYGLSKSILVATGDFKANMVITIPRTLFPVFAVLGTLLLTQHIVWIIGVYFLSNMVASWAMYQFALWKLRVKESAQDVADTVLYGTHLSALGFFVAVSSQIDQLLLFHFAGGATLAIYALALAPVQEARGALDNFVTILFARIAGKSTEDARRSTSLRARQMFLISLAATLAYIACIPFLFYVLFPQYTASILVTQVLALTLLFQPRGILDAYLLAHGEIKKRYVWILSSQVIKLTLNVSLIPFFGLWGVVAAAITSEAITALVIYFVYRTTRPQAARV